jgi:hypothetical protein
MNERIKELANQAKFIAEETINRKISANTELYAFAEKLAELIVQECIYTLQLKIVRNGNTPENLRSREHIKDLGEKFGIKFPMDYYPDRNKHFGVEE